ncbi:MAG: hypothetical protein EOO90_01290 [Pedobacter sp.]|nr:MAG: hypothetical protein EOO90_01290 [Pedobacter sp.]
MSKNKKCSLPPLFALLILLSVLIYGCAAMQSPQGGPIDKIPPKVLKMEPANLTTNFKAQKIVITFDEHFNIDNEAKEFSVSPEQERNPIFKKDKKNLEITFQDSLESNTTYTINFGNGIVDVNERNILKNLTYAFSTGPYLDSLSISGRVTNSQTGKPELDATVFIIPLSRDSIFGKRKASIFTSTDSSGLYSLKNLKKDTYRIYALKETGGDKIYQQRSDEIGFIKDSIVLDKNLDSINLAVFKEAPESFRISDRKFNNDGSIQLIFNKSLTKPELTIIDNKAINENKILSVNKTNDSLKLWVQDLSFDSIKVEIKDNTKVLDTVVFRREKKDTYTRNLTISDNLQSSLLNPYQPYRIYSNFPIENIDRSKIKLTEDSIPRTNFTVEKDTANLLAFNFKYPWKKKAKYVVDFGEGALTAIFNTKSKALRKTFSLEDPVEYGSFILNVEVPDTGKSYIVQLLDERKTIVASHIITTNKSITYSNYKVGSYYTRVIYDDNKNGVWDTGSLEKGTQPEYIWNNPVERTNRPSFVVTLTFNIPPPPQKKTTIPEKEKPKSTDEIKQ